MQLKLIRESLPASLKPLAIERAIEGFLKEIDPHGDEIGFFNQTIKGIHAAVYRNNGDFWLAVDEEGDVAAYALGSVTTDIDDRLTYWLTQAYVAPKHRGLGHSFWQVLREKAKEYMCKHIVVVSGRDNNEAYCRFLGKGWGVYATLLKEDL